MNKEELLEKYLDKTMSNDEKIAFEKYYEEDKSFKELVDKYKDLMKGIQYAGEKNIRDEVKSIHVEMKATIKSEVDVIQSLELNERNKNVSEINSAKEGIVKKLMPIKMSTKTLMLIRSVTAIAATLLVGILASIIYTRSNKISISQPSLNALTKSIAFINQEAQQVGLIDIDKTYKEHQIKIFELLANNEMSKAISENNTFFKDDMNNARYALMEGIILIKVGNYTGAKISLRQGVDKGDGCVCKLLLTLLSNENDKSKVLNEIKVNTQCNKTAWIHSLLEDLKL